MTQEEQNKIQDLQFNINLNKTEVKKIKHKMSKLKKYLEDEEGLGYSEIIEHREYKKLNLESVKYKRKISSLDLELIKLKDILRKKYKCSKKEI